MLILANNILLGPMFCAGLVGTLGLYLGEEPYNMGPKKINLLFSVYSLP